MPSDNWGTPGRDTFRLEAHEQFLAFLASDGAPYTPPYTPIQTKLSHPIEPPRVRTWKKLFEKMGILYVTDRALHLTDFGLVLQDQLSRSIGEPENNRLIARSALTVLGKYQLNNPTSELDYPEDCDILPYWVIWKVMREFGDKLHWEELNRVVLRIMKMEQMNAAVRRIKDARGVSRYPEGCSDSTLTKLLGEKVNLPQRGRAMAAIFSEAGFGGCIIERRRRGGDPYRYLNPEHLDLIDQVLRRTPSFTEFTNASDWFEYYGKLAEPPFSPLPKSVLREVERYPREVVDLVAEAYLIGGKSHRDIQKELLGRPAPAHGGGFKAMEILHYLGLDESTKGIFRGLPTPPEAEALLHRVAPWLTPQQVNMLIGILSGYKVAQEVDKAFSAGYFTGETEVESVSTRRVRKQQDKLRELLLNIYCGRCAICDVDDPVLLRASHIIPWAIDKQNRLNPENALLLCIFHDKLFEEGLISFDDDMSLLISKALSRSTSKVLRAIVASVVAFQSPKRFNPGSGFLNYHRGEKFQRHNW